MIAARGRWCTAIIQPPLAAPVIMTRWKVVV